MPKMLSFWKTKFVKRLKKRFTFVHFLFLKKICQPFDFSSFLSENFKIVKNLKRSFKKYKINFFLFVHLLNTKTKVDRN